MLVSLASGWIVAVGTIVVAIDTGDDEDRAAAFASDLHGQHFADEGEERGWRVNGAQCEVIAAANVGQRPEDHLLEVGIDLVGGAFLASAASFAWC